MRSGGVIASYKPLYDGQTIAGSAEIYRSTRGASRRDTLTEQRFQGERRNGSYLGYNLLQKRDRPIDIEPDWIHLDRQRTESPSTAICRPPLKWFSALLKLDDMMYGDKKDVTCEQFPDANLADLLHESVRHIGGEYRGSRAADLGDGRND